MPEETPVAVVLRVRPLRIDEVARPGGQVELGSSPGNASPADTLPIWRLAGRSTLVEIGGALDEFLDGSDDEAPPPYSEWPELRPDDASIEASAVLMDPLAAADVHDAVGRSAVCQAVDGVHGAVIAYGPPRSGKSFTIDQIAMGALRDVFALAERANGDELVVALTCAQVARDTVADLLAGDAARQPSAPAAETDWIDAMTRVRIHSLNQASTLLAVARDRLAGDAAMPTHFVLRLAVETLHADSLQTTMACIDLVDLCTRPVVPACGNLADVDTCIRALAAGQLPPAPIGPLSRIVRPALMGNTRTTFVCTLRNAARDRGAGAEAVALMRLAASLTTQTQRNVLGEDDTDGPAIGAARSPALPARSPRELASPIALPSLDDIMSRPARQPSSPATGSPARISPFRRRRRASSGAAAQLSVSAAGSPHASNRSLSKYLDETDSASSPLELARRKAQEGMGMMLNNMDSMLDRHASASAFVKLHAPGSAARARHVDFASSPPAGEESETDAQITMLEHEIDDLDRSLPLMRWLADQEDGPEPRSPRGVDRSNASVQVSPDRSVEIDAARSAMSNHTLVTELASANEHLADLAEQLEAARGEKATLEAAAADRVLLERRIDNLQATLNDRTRQLHQLHGDHLAAGKAQRQLQDTLAHTLQLLEERKSHDAIASAVADELLGSARAGTAATLAREAHGSEERKQLLARLLSCRAVNADLLAHVPGPQLASALNDNFK